MKLVFDIEANGFYDDVTQVWCIVTKNIESGRVNKFRPDEIEEALLHLGAADELIGHNIITYDLPVLQKLYGFRYNGVITDTLIMSRLFNPDRKKPALDWNSKKMGGPHSLAAWGYRLGRGKPVHEDWSQFSNDMLHRCIEDVKINHLLLKHLWKEAEGNDWSLALRIETQTAKVMWEMERYGWLVDRELIVELIQDLDEKIYVIDSEVLPRIPLRMLPYGAEVKKPFKNNGELTKNMLDFWQDQSSLVAGPHCRIKWEEINLGSDIQVKNYLLSVGWRPTEWNRSKKTGEITSPKLTEDSFDSLKDDTGILVAKRMKYKHRRSQLEGWLKVIRNDGRIGQIISGLTPTGRYTHQRIVNVPGGDAVYGHEMRSVFVSKEGYSIVGCDAASCQLRMLCHYMGDKDYTHAVLHGNKEDGTDIHSVNMRATEGLITVRKIAKNFIYGLLFGAQDPKLGAILGGTAADGTRLRAKFMKNLPALKRLVDGIESAYKKRGFLKGLDGRKLYPRAPHQLLVYLMQCAESVLMKVAICYLDSWIKKEELDAHFIAFVHDEVQLEVKDEHAERVAQLAELAIVKAGEYLGLNLPAAGEADIGKNWSETH